ncbi:MAG: trypsin-like peptidase domain-containing protein [Propionibacteriaceae bacterium]|nr:trypsin-like peptidase domain-containing protein [Propionibacteriaceae bacterium]
MTAPWPPPSQRPVSRPPSLVLVVAGVVLALGSQLGTAVAVTGATSQWRDRLWPTPSASAPPTAPATAPASPTPDAGPTGGPRPEQTVGPVDVTDAIKQGVVLVSGRTPEEGVAGTGMVVDAEGFVLTNYHVVRSTESITVTLASTGRRHTARLVGRDATKDVALLELENPRDLQEVTLDEGEVLVGDVVVVAGNAHGQGFLTAHRGNVLGLGRAINVKGASEYDPPQRLNGLIETNAPAWPGDSGGPMFDADGEVLGMTTAGTETSEETEDKQVYAVPIREAMAVVEQIRRGDESGTVVIGPKAYLGLYAEADDTDGIKVASVQDDSPAADAGMEGGEQILSFDGQTVTTRAELSDVLDTIEPGTTVPITWRTADGDEVTAEITPTSSPLN